MAADIMSGVFLLSPLKQLWAILEADPHEVYKSDGQLFKKKKAEPTENSTVQSFNDNHKRKR